MVDDMVGCGRIVGSVGDDGAQTAPSQTSSDALSQEAIVTATVGQKAPDFTAPS